MELEKFDELSDDMIEELYSNYEDFISEVSCWWTVWCQCNHDVHMIRHGAGATKAEAIRDCKISMSTCKNVTYTEPGQVCASSR